MYPDRDTLSNVPRSGYITARDEHNNTNTKPQAKKQRFLKLSKKFPEEKQQLVEENDADNNYKEGTL